VETRQILNAKLGWKQKGLVDLAWGYTKTIENPQLK
jgi:hypothetical protein